jgi:hypothetical protein
MRHRGINYDTGFLNAGTSTRESFDPDVVRREMRIIRHDLHCTAVRITGGEPDRLETAATHAADAGLGAWFCPFTNGLTQDELLALLADCADRAERLRRRGAEVVLFTGSEVSLFTAGFLPGETIEERLALVADPLRVRPLIGEVRARINAFLRRAVDGVRARFGGAVSYASLPLEGVDWTPFDVIATDAAYRSAATAGQFPDLVRAFVAQGRAQGKPVAITEFGCMTYRGAADQAIDIHSIVAWGDDGRPDHLNGEYVRDEGRAGDLPARSCWTSSRPRGSTPRSCTPSRATTFRTATIRARTSTWRAAAWSRCSTLRAPQAVRAAGATPACRGSRKPRSTSWPSGSGVAQPNECSSQLNHGSSHSSTDRCFGHAWHRQKPLSFAVTIGYTFPSGGS